jgi:hypothetical protein
MRLCRSDYTRKGDNRHADGASLIEASQTDALGIVAYIIRPLAAITMTG